MNENARLCNEERFPGRSMAKALDDPYIDHPVKANGIQPEKSMGCNYLLIDGGRRYCLPDCGS